MNPLVKSVVSKTQGGLHIYDAIAVYMHVCVLMVTEIHWFLSPDKKTYFVVVAQSGSSTPV